MRKISGWPMWSASYRLCSLYVKSIIQFCFLVTDFRVQIQFDYHFILKSILLPGYRLQGTEINQIMILFSVVLELVDLLTPNLLSWDLGNQVFILMWTKNVSMTEYANHHETEFLEMELTKTATTFILLPSDLLLVSRQFFARERVAEWATVAATHWIVLCLLTSCRCCKKSLQCQLCGTHKEHATSKLFFILISN